MLVAQREGGLFSALHLYLAREQWEAAAHDLLPSSDFKISLVYRCIIYMNALQGVCLRLSPPFCVSFVPLVSIIPPLAFGPCSGLAGVNRLGPCGFFRLVNCIVDVMKHMHFAILAAVHCLQLDTGRPDVGLASRWKMQSSSFCTSERACHGTSWPCGNKCALRERHALCAQFVMCEMWLWGVPLFELAVFFFLF